MPVIPARPTLYKGIQMRSRLEADYAAFLDRQLESRPNFGSWEYEAECLASKNGQWLPDFRIMLTHGTRIFIELKPSGLLAEWERDGTGWKNINQLLCKMEIARETYKDCVLWLYFWEYGQTSTLQMQSLPHGRNAGKWTADTPGIPFSFLFERCDEWCCSEP